MGSSTFRQQNGAARSRRRPRTDRLGRALAAITLAALAGAMLPAHPADAFKPFTHKVGGNEVWDDVAEDGMVRIGDRDYPVPAQLAAALQEERCSYNAGLIGPDGFPDVVMGQSVVHPSDTGAWLDLVLQAAWDAQSLSSGYTAEERRRILAFSYGYMTHAAGDLWVHTMINELSEGVFPGLGEVLEEPATSLIALRHVLIEGYIGDTTPGFDGNPSFANFGGDDTNDSTPGICFEAPERFIYDVLVDQDVSIPANDDGIRTRGILLDFFWWLHGELEAWAEDLPTFEGSLNQALAALDDAKDALVAFYDACLDDFSFEGCADFLGTLWDEGFEAAEDFFEGVVTASTLGVFRAYLDAWVEDIEQGLQAWPEVGMIWTKAAFDPQFGRDMANYICGAEQALEEGSLTRRQCEAGVGLEEKLFHPSTTLRNYDDFINEHLLRMLGVPDLVGDARALLGDIEAQVQQFIAALRAPLRNPILENEAQMKQAAEDLIRDAINDTFGVDLDAVTDALDSPSSKLDVLEIALGDVFTPQDHATLDGHLGLGPDHHHPDVQLLGPIWESATVSGPLRDEAAFDPEGFKAFKNTQTMSKLLLLDGSTLNDVIADVLIDGGIIRADRGHLIRTFQAGENVMVDSLDSVLAGGGRRQEDPWLLNIDGDHAWRADRQPKFASGPFAGTGRFPLWESCLARPVFRGLFDDWENPDHPEQPHFPDLEDLTSPDPSDLVAPTNQLVGEGDAYQALDGTIYVGANHTLVHSAEDNLFTTQHLELSHRASLALFRDPLIPTENPGRFSLPTSSDQTWNVQLVSSDPCSNTDLSDVRTVIVDTTPPELETGGPYVIEEGTLLLLEGSGTDAGSGLASLGWSSEDPALFAQGVDPASFVPADDGIYAVTLTGVDNVGNTVGIDTTITVTNRAPVVRAGEDRVVAEGDLVTLAPSRFNDPGTLDRHTATVEWGDQTAADAGVVIELPFGPPGSTGGLDGSVGSSHVYADDGVYTVNVCVTDDDGGSGCDALTVTVTNADPIVVIDQVGDGPDFFLPLVDIGVAGTFRDAGTLDTHSATVNWDDGITTTAAVAESPFGPPGSTAGAVGTFSSVHAYASAGLYTVVASVRDDDRGVGTVPTVVEVITPEQALERVVEMLIDDSEDPDVSDAARAGLAEALKDLDGTRGGTPNSGALDKLRAGDLPAAVLKIKYALADLSATIDADPTLDLSIIQLVLTQVAESIAADLLQQAEVASDPQSKGQQRQINSLKSRMDEGRAHRATGEWSEAVGAFNDVTKGATDFLS